MLPPPGVDSNGTKDVDIDHLKATSSAAAAAAGKDVTPGDAAAAEDGANSKDVAHVGSPFATAAGQSKDHWQKAREHVQRNVALSQAFTTLRDMNGHDFIEPKQLTTVKRLGQGAFATVEQAM